MKRKRKNYSIMTRQEVISSLTPFLFVLIWGLRIVKWYKCGVEENILFSFVLYFLIFYMVYSPLNSLYSFHYKVVLFIWYSRDICILSCFVYICDGQISVIRFFVLNHDICKLIGCQSCCTIIMFSLFVFMLSSSAFVFGTFLENRLGF